MKTRRASPHRHVSRFSSLQCILCSSHVQCNYEAYSHCAKALSIQYVETGIIACKISFSRSEASPHPFLGQFATCLQDSQRALTTTLSDFRRQGIFLLIVLVLGVSIVKVKGPWIH